MGESDLAVCRTHGVDIVFAPTADDLYASGTDIHVDPGPLGTLFEGAIRPGHFSGMLTVVLKLINVVRPDESLFGEKDYQQLALIRRMVDQLNVPTNVVGVETVRETDGLARSSRNVYLTEAERQAAAVIPRATAAVAAAEAGLEQSTSWPQRRNSSAPSRASRSTTSPWCPRSSGRRRSKAPLAWCSRRRSAPRDY